MKAILEFDAPESCAECILMDMVDVDCLQYWCVPTEKMIYEVRYESHDTIDKPTDRAPFCPLEIVPDGGEQ